MTSSQPDVHRIQFHRHFIVHRYTVHTACIHVLAYIILSRIARLSPDFRVSGYARQLTLASSPGPVQFLGGAWRQGWCINMREQICIHDITHITSKNDLCTQPKKIGQVQRSFVVRVSYKIRARPCKSSDVISLKYTDIR